MGTGTAPQSFVSSRRNSSLTHRAAAAAAAHMADRDSARNGSLSGTGGAKDVSQV
jgi:hypothetical protein